MTTSGASQVDSPEERAVNALRKLLQAGDGYRHKVANYFGLGWTELQAVGFLVLSDELGQTELASRLGITTAAATSLVDRLEMSEVAARHPHPQDRRRSLIRLTEKGHELVSRSREWTNQAFDGLTDAKLDVLAKDLLGIADKLNDQVKLL